MNICMYNKIYVNAAAVLYLNVFSSVFTFCASTKRVKTILYNLILISD